MAYKTPRFLTNAHLETIYPALFRKVNFVYQKTELISTPDNDLLEISTSTQQADKLVIVSHGLEGNKDRAYIKGMAKACFDSGFDILVWNYRGCGSQMNKQLRFYHSGATDDLDTVVQHALGRQTYASINLIGFSLGGNITLKYLGEDRKRSDKIKKAIAVSVPMDLKASCEKLSQPSNKIYAERFLKSLKNKIITKAKLLPGIDITQLKSIKTLKQFDDLYTAPLHGYKDADDYYHRCSSVRFVNFIEIPTLIINALNDPFLTAECYPTDLLKNHQFVSLETPVHGGHVGFAQFNKSNMYWSEERALQFLNSVEN